MWSKNSKSTECTKTTEDVRIRYIRCNFSENDATSDISHISSFILNIVPFNEHGLRQIDYQVQ